MQDDSEIFELSGAEVSGVESVLVGVSAAGDGAAPPGPQTASASISQSLIAARGVYSQGHAAVSHVQEGLPMAQWGRWVPSQLPPDPGKGRLFDPCDDSELSPSSRRDHFGFGSFGGFYSDSDASEIFEV
ncbi:unnamed protein product [Prorocentrum cordatum]|uniref:Uncharacterized protein n=1 Tax=Prorocentrum cordatum TaxID=2364126 RepID=A0ABN9SP54_9DINO|nr:unnamed protein product [Polarella glacialis]